MKFSNFLKHIIGTLLSRFSGFLREMVFAWYLGGRFEADALFVAFRFTNFFRDIVAENSATRAFIPVYTKWENSKTFWTIFIFFLLLSASIFSILFSFSPLFLKIFAPGFSFEKDKFVFLVKITRLSLPFLVLVSLSAFNMAILHKVQKFFVASFSPVFFNLGIIFFALLAYFKILPYENIVKYFAIGFVLGGFLQFLFLFSFSYKYYPKFDKFDFKSESFKSFLKILLSVGLSSMFLRVSLLINTIIASFLKEGSIAYLNYAYRLIHLPIGLVGVGVSTVILPSISEKLKKFKNVFYEIEEAIVVNLHFTLPIMLFYIFEGLDVVRIVYQRGVFSYNDAINVYKAMLYYSMTIPFFSLSGIFLNYFYAKLNSRIPNYSFVISTFVNLSVALLFVKKMGFVALAMATSLASFAQFLFLFLKSDFKFAYPIKLRGVFLLNLIWLGFLIIFKNFWLKFLVMIGIYLFLIYAYTRRVKKNA